MVGEVGFKLKLSETFPIIFKERKVIKTVTGKRQMIVSHDYRYKKKTKIK